MINFGFYLVVYFMDFTEQDLSQDWPVSDDIDLDDMEYHEGNC